MVRIGDFSLELVEAESKVPFIEHTGPAPDNFVYAEVEPDVEYFIKVGSNREEEVWVRLSVDGVEFRATKFSRLSSPYLAGYNKQENGERTKMALQFRKSLSRNQSSNFSEFTQNSQSMWTGKVEAKFYQLGKPIGVRERSSNFAWKSLDDKNAIIGKKGVSTTKGKFVLEKKTISHLRKIYENGPHLCTITLNYCTAAGLIGNKVFKPPPPASSAPIRLTAERSERRAKKKVKREPTESKAVAAPKDPVESTLKLMKQLDSVNKQIATLEEDSDLSNELKQQMIQKLKETKVEIGKMMVAGSEKNPIQISMDSDSD